MEDGKEGFVPDNFVERLPDGINVPSAPMWDKELDSDDVQKLDEKENIEAVVLNASQYVEGSPVPGLRFSLVKLTNAFSKSDAVGDYLTGLTSASQTVMVAEEPVFINESSDGHFQWVSHSEPYTCMVGTPRKSSKFGGIKPFLTYGVTPSFTDIEVSRRYKHFAWLYERLVGKFGTIIAIPPLPEKLLTGMFDDDLMENRRIQL